MKKSIAGLLIFTLGAHGAVFKEPDAIPSKQVVFSKYGAPHDGHPTPHAHIEVSTGTSSTSDSATYMWGFALEGNVRSTAPSTSFTFPALYVRAAPAAFDGAVRTDVSSGSVLSSAAAYTTAYTTSSV